jgi:hypothetical protein
MNQYFDRKLQSTRPLLLVRDQAFFHVEELPWLPPPKKIGVGSASIVIDDEVLIPAPAPSTLWNWFAESVNQWIQANPSVEYRRMLHDVIDACERQMADITQSFRDAPRKDLIAKVVVPFIDNLLKGAAVVAKFEEDINRKTALIHLDLRPEPHLIEICVDRFSIIRPTPASRALSAKWAPKNWAWPTPTGASRLRIEEWRFSQDSPACSRLGCALPKKFDIPLHLPLNIVKSLFKN